MQANPGKPWKQGFKLVDSWSLWSGSIGTQPYGLQ